MGKGVAQSLSQTNKNCTIIISISNTKYMTNNVLTSKNIVEIF